jgi:hypothetical protein
MVATEQDTTTMAHVPGDLIVEKLITILSNNTVGVVVDDSSGNPMGVVTPISLIQTLAAFEDSSESDNA